ncbi:MAG: response regulator transcription factor [Ekhidna sp.]
MITILLIEDDNSLGYILKEYLQMHDFFVVWAKDGEEGLEKFNNGNFDICIVDVMMPKRDGFSLAVEIKTTDPQMPLIFLTAKSMKIDKLKGFKVGCDDYIVKPVEEEELIARIQAVLRRSGNIRSSKERYTIGRFDFHAKNQVLTLNEASIHLTQKESKVLEMLCEDMGELIERDSILKSLWGDNSYFKRRSMDVFISKLRKYLEADPEVRITNVHGKGYILEIITNQG